MTKEHMIDHYGTRALDDRQRLLGRLARPAAGRQRLSRRLPGHHAAVLVHRTRGRRRSSTRSTTSACSYFENPTRWDPGVALRPDRDQRVLRPPEPANPVTFTTAIPNSRRPVAAVPRRAGRPGLRRADEPAGRALHAAGLHGQRVRPRRARLRPPRLRQRRRPVRAQGPARRAGSRRPSSSTSTRTSAARTSTSTSTAERTAADPIALERALPDRRDQPGRQPRQGRDHRPARARPRRLPRRLPHVRDARAPGARASAPPPTRCCGAARSR